MSKPRCQLSAAEISEMLESLVRRLESVGVPTPPEVACKILDLVANPDAQVNDFAKVIRTDAALSGRLLRLVNSAYFAQTKPVTALERACSLLGIERLRSFSLGFYLSRGAASDPLERLSRRVWGQSVFRACLSAELARRMAPRVSSEAFVIGLMLDCALPLMPKLAGAAFTPIMESGEPPGRQFAMEFKTLPFTHVDAAVAMGVRWRLPELLARPIDWHHTPPTETVAQDTLHKLHRIAYYVGAIDLDCATYQTKQPAPLPDLAMRALGMPARDLEAAVGRAAGEYGASIGLFAQVAESVADVDELSARVHHQLFDILDKELGKEAEADAQKAALPRFALGGFAIALEPGEAGDAVAVLYDSTGTPLVCHRFRVAGTTAEGLRAALGLDPGSGDQIAQIGEYLRGMAA